MVLSLCDLSSTACPSVLVPICCPAPFPTIPLVSQVSMLAREETSSDYNTSHRYNLRSLSKQPVVVGQGLGISSPLMIPKSSRGRQSYISKAIHKASMDVAEVDSYHLMVFLKQEATQKWFPDEVVIF